jgi:hypothetical protein
MPSLHETQAEFMAAIVDAAAPFRHGGGNRLGGGTAMAVYRNNLVGNLSDALRSIYSAVEALVGPEFFDHAAAAHVRSEPSRTGNLNDYGAGFGEFLADFPGLEGLPYIRDVASLEWACHEALLAADHDPLDPASLATIAGEHYSALRFVLHPGVRLVSSGYPLFRIWQLCQAPDNADTLYLDAGAESVLVSRPQGKVELEVLSRGDFALLGAIARGLSFGRASEEAMLADPRLDLVASLQRLVLNGTIVDWRLDTADSKQEDKP